MFGPSTGYIQKNNPFPVTSCGRRRNMGSPLHSNEPRKTTKGKGRNFRTVEEGAGMTKKGVETYKRKNPGKKVRPPQPEGGPRKDAYCARSAGIPKCKNPDKNGDCPNDIAKVTEAQAKYKIAVVPTIIIFKDGEEAARFQADLSFKMVATKEEVQEEIDNQLMSDF